MDDTISRQDAIDAIVADKIEDGLPVITDTQERDFEVFNSSCDRHAKILKELPSAQWIPCSERLPKEEGVYPVVINGTEPALSVKYEQGFAMGYFAPIDEAWEIDGHEELIHDLEVLAWFELPPYKAESEDKE